MAPALVIPEDAPETNKPTRPHSAIPTPPTTTPQPWTPSTVLSTIPSHSQPTPSTPSPVPFFHLLARLKSTKREGWRRFGIDHGESIADHMYRMSIICMCLPNSLSHRLDRDRCVRLALVHDMAELLVGDITPVDGVVKSEKNRREAGTMDFLCEALLGEVDGGVQGRELRAAWQEYEDGRTDEAQFVKDVDKYELILQMLDYERQGEGRYDLTEFTWVAGRIVFPEVRAWSEQTLREREEFWREHVGKMPGAKYRSEETKEQQDEYYGEDVKIANGHA